ncbi:MAG: DUF1573 domain-containing protein [Candidatus Omnitrophota bacterium]
MRRAISFVLFSVFVFSICLAQMVELKENTWDFGKVRVSEGVVKHVFPLTNDSVENLNVNGTHASCGCTLSEIDRKVILPKETASLEVKFNPKGYSGKITQYVYVNTDSKNMPIYRFIIKAEVIKD